jgi:Family of unknown function (DUF6134)
MTRCFTFVGLAAFMLCAPSANAALPDGRTLVFDAYRSGTKIGTHTMRFRQIGPKLMVDIDIALKGKVFFIGFSYNHRNQEVWEGDQLVSLASRTESNGKVSTLTADRSADGRLALSINGTASSAAAMFSTSYWNPLTPKQAALLNSQKGEVILLKLDSRKPALAPAVQGGDIQATAYAMTGSKNFNATPLYDAKGCLVGLNFKAPKDVARISYKLVQRLDAKAAPDLAANPRLAPCLDGATGAPRG